MKKYYIGMSTTFHDPALAIVDQQGEILFAEATERHLQNKRGLNCEPDNVYYLPEVIKNYCDPQAEFVVATNWPYFRPWLEMFPVLLRETRAESLIKESYGRFVKKFFLEKYKMAYQLALFHSGHRKRGVSFVKSMRDEFANNNISFRHYCHHLTHALMACYTSPFDQATCMVVDSYGGNSSLSYYCYQDNELRQIKKFYGTQSLGFLYMKLTELCGFSWIKGEEWKVMGLAACGKFDQEIYALLQELLEVRGMNIRICNSRKLNKVMAQLTAKQRPKESSVYQAADFAYTGQYFFSQVMEQLLNNFHHAYPSENLVLTGGCALNSAFNGQIVKKTPFANLYVPSAPGDDGTAVGAAILAYLEDEPVSRKKFFSPYLGARFSQSSLNRLERFGQLPKMRHLPDSICQETARLLSQGKLVGWVQGRAEFGPRALGNRSILADPRIKDMKQKLNDRVKFREEYRPFAPSILHEMGADYFEDYQESPYMERTLYFRPEVREKVPAVVHFDGTGRLQTVKKEWNSKYYQLIEEFYQLTSVPILLNTSLNVMGKPIVHSLEDVMAMFFTTGLDVLVIEDYLIEK